MSEVAALVARLEALAASVQTNVPEAERSPNHKRIDAALLQADVVGSVLFRVPDDYYSRPLQARAELLGAPAFTLCKTLLIENPLGTVVGDLKAPLHAQRFVAVLLQYISKLQLEGIAKMLRAPGGIVPDLRMAKDADATALTGYVHGGHTPYASAKPVPLIVSAAIAGMGASIPGAYVWLGAGDVNLKLRLFITQLLRPGVLEGSGYGAGYAPTVLDCTVLRKGDADDDEE